MTFSFRDRDTENSLHCRGEPSRSAKEVRNFEQKGRVFVTTEQEGRAGNKPQAEPCWVAASYLADIAPSPVRNPNPRKHADPGTTTSNPCEASKRKTTASGVRVTSVMTSSQALLAPNAGFDCTDA